MLYLSYPGSLQGTGCMQIKAVGREEQRGNVLLACLCWGCNMLASGRVLRCPMESHLRCTRRIVDVVMPAAVVHLVACTVVGASEMSSATRNVTNKMRAMSHIVSK